MPDYGDRDFSMLQGETHTQCSQGITDILTHGLNGPQSIGRYLGGQGMIALRAEACSNLLKNLLLNAQSSRSNFQPHKLRTERAWAEDQTIKLNLWASSLGVFASGHASIKHRLRDHVEVHDMVMQYLDALHANLQFRKLPLLHLCRY